MGKRQIFLWPGYVTSPTDGDRHFLGPARLAELHGVRLRDCIVMSDQPEAWRGRRMDGIHLGVRSNGVYPHITNAKLRRGLNK